MSKPKFFIVAIRYNPQIGLYLSNVIVGDKRENKNTISCKYDFYGDRKSLRFGYSTATDGSHYCLSPDKSLYGSMTYYGFDTAAGAKSYIDNHFSGSHNYDSAMKTLGF